MHIFRDFILKECFPNSLMQILNAKQFGSFDKTIQTHTVRSKVCAYCWLEQNYRQEQEPIHPDLKVKKFENV